MPEREARTTPIRLLDSRRPFEPPPSHGRARPDPTRTSRPRPGAVRVQRLHEERARNPILAGALERLAEWQARRLRVTYADLAADPRYSAAIEFFQNDLYGAADFSQRDADLARVVPMLVRVLPESVIMTAAAAMELNGTVAGARSGAAGAAAARRRLLYGRRVLQGVPARRQFSAAAPADQVDLEDRRRNRPFGQASHSYAPR